MFCSSQKCTLENFRWNGAYNLAVCLAAKLKEFPKHLKCCPERFLVHSVPGDIAGSCDVLWTSLT